MPTNLKAMMQAANAVVPRITPAQAREMIARGNALIVDVRETQEVETSGKAAGAIHVSRGLLEFRADPDHHPTTSTLPRTRTSSFTAAPAAEPPWPASCSRIWATSGSTTLAASKTGPMPAAKWKSERLRKFPACSPRSRIERVSQPIADEIERQHGQEDRQSRPDRHPRRIDEKSLRRIQHAAP
jgi:hypothetical protein